MNRHELVHRVGEQLRQMEWLLASRLGRSKAVVTPAPETVQFCIARDPQLPELQYDRAVLAEYRGLVQGQWPALGYDWKWTDAPDVWRRAPDSHKVWPRDFFGSIDYRPGNPYGDIRVAWEPARLQQLVALGLVAGRADRTADVVRLLEDELLSWVRHNPLLEGIHYISAMECGLRIISVCHALDLVRAKMTRQQQIWRAVLTLVAGHAAMIEKRLSLFSSAGNHTIAECAGLIYAGILFPELDGAQRWLDKALVLMTDEMDRQVLPDGGGIEQAFWYLLFIADLCGLVLLVLKQHGRAVPDRLEAAWERARLFLNAMAGPDGEIPAVGDSDNGFALVPGLRLSLNSHQKQRDTCQYFPDAGYTLLHQSSVPSMTVLFDHGPLGMPPSFGHGHADALAVSVRAGDTELLIDPGTFTYTGDAQFRRYFRSTSAHNTVTVDGRDQASQETPFMWSDPYHARRVHLERKDAVVLVLGCHDGYMKRHGVMHWRGIALGPFGLWVWDHLAGSGHHDVSVHWHLGVEAMEAVRGARLESGYMLELQGADTLSSSLDVSVSQGGWRSRLYGRKESIWMVTGNRTGELPCTIVTTLLPEGRNIPISDASVFQDRFREWMRSTDQGV